MLNKATLIGHVGKAPEIRSFQNGNRVAQFSIATTERWKNKEGVKQEKTQWHKIAVFNEPLVKLTESYIRKGSKIYLEGQIETREYEKDGEKKYITEIVLRPFNGEIRLLDSKADRENEPAPEDRPAPVRAASTDIDDEIPF